MPRRVHQHTCDKIHELPYVKYNFKILRYRQLYRAFIAIYTLLMLYGWVGYFSLEVDNNYKRTWCMYRTLFMFGGNNWIICRHILFARILPVTNFKTVWDRWVGLIILFFFFYRSLIFLSENISFVFYFVSLI